MEPMTLGSPSGSPSTNASPYLPSFLMGDSNMQAPSTPRSNTLSPNKRNVSFATSPVTASAQDFNRSALSQKTLFGGYQQQPQSPSPGLGNITGNYAGTPHQGPPTQGLFDTLRNERNQVQTPVRSVQPSQTQCGTPVHNSSAFGLNQSFQQPQNQSTQQTFSYNHDSYLSNASFNVSRAAAGLVSPLSTTSAVGASLNNSHMLQCPPTPRYTEFWVTVYGFPSSAVSTILQHFSQCGTIIDKVFPPHNGNWVHLKYSSRLESDKALNYNEKILGNNIMIGVTQCKDKNIIDKENLCENVTPSCKVRPLAQTAYNSAQVETSVVGNPNAPQKSTGIMNKAMDLFFGW